MHTTIDSPVGPLTLVSTDGRLSGMYMHEQRHRPPTETFGEPDPTPFTAVIAQLEEYFDGDRTDFDLPLSLRGTPFRRSVWDELTRIPYGETISYGELAARLGNPAASRAVGLANGRNPVGIIVPCHRVVGSTGSLTGYGGGIERKRHLLAFERGLTEPYLSTRTTSGGRNWDRAPTTPAPRGLLSAIRSDANSATPAAAMKPHA